MLAKLAVSRDNFGERVMKHILVIADPGEDEQPAFFKALQFAQKTRTSIHVAIVCYESLHHIMPIGAPDSEDIDLKNHILQHKEQWWQEFIHPHQSVCTITFKVVWEKYLHKWVRSYCETHTNDLIIKTGHRSERAFHMPSDWRLFREIHIPIYVISEEHFKPKPVVLACVDVLSKNPTKLELNQKVLTNAHWLAEQLQVALHACYAIKIPTLIRELEVIDIPAHIHKMEGLARQQAPSMLDSYGINLEKFHVCEGVPWGVLSNLGYTLKAECIVLGSMAHTGISGRLVGNTAEKVIHYTKTDLLVVNR